MAVVLTLVQTKQIRINIHTRNNTKNTVKTIQNTANTSTHITIQVHIWRKDIKYKTKSLMYSYELLAIGKYIGFYVHSEKFQTPWTPTVSLVNTYHAQPVSSANSSLVQHSIFNTDVI